MMHSKIVMACLLMYGTSHIFCTTQEKYNNEMYAFDSLKQEDLKNSILSIYKKSLNTQVYDVLPFEFRSCARKLMNNNSVSHEECKQALQAYTELLSTIINMHIRDLTSNKNIIPLVDPCPANAAILKALGKRTSIIDSVSISQTLLNIEASLSDATCNARLLHRQDIGTLGFTISTPGVYKLAEDVTFTPTISTAALTITTSDVLLDLQCFSIKQSGIVANVHGIRVASAGHTLENITVQGGLVSNISGTGIFVSQVSNFNLQNMTFSKCGLAGIDIEGTNNGVLVDSCDISLSCTLGNNLGALGTDALSVFILSTVNNGKVSNCNIYNNQVQASDVAIGTLNGFSILSCNAVQVNNCTSYGNLCRQYLGFNFNSSNNSIVTSCSSQQDTGQTGGDCSGFFLQSCNGISIYNSSVQGFSAGNTVNAIQLNGTSGSLLQNCVVIDNDNSGGGRFRGILLNGASFNAVENCLISRNQAGTQATGIDLSSDNNVISKTIVSFNATANDICQGVLVNGSTNMIIDSDISENTGDISDDSFGVNIVGGTGNLFSYVRAFNNGTNPANQLNGVAAGSQVALDTSTMNTTAGAGPFGNAGIVP